MNLPLLSLLTLTPLAGAAVLLALPAPQKRVARQVALLFSGLALLGALALWLRFDPRAGGLQFVERHQWIPSLGVDYYLGVDGLGLLMVLLSALVVPLAILTCSIPEERSPGFHALVLALQAGLFGSFTALNFFHWFIFWELGLIPAYFLIKLWGGNQRRAAATQFFVYTMVGSVALLLSFLALQLVTGTFDLIQLAELARNGALKTAVATHLGQHGFSADTILSFLFLGALLGFAVKVPLVPLHTWLPGAYAEAPTGVTMILTGVMSKMGLYGFLRLLLPIFPEQMRTFQTPLLCLALATIIFSASAAFAQKDLKRMLAYSSINHLGFCLLGIFAVLKVSGPNLALANEKAWALNGVLLQMFNHGLTASALFCFVALLEARGGGLRGLDDFGGLRKVVPVLCGLMGIAAFASLGLPGLNGFVSEFLILKGVFSLSAWSAFLAVYGLLATAVFYLTFLQKVFCGPLNQRWQTMPDLTLQERWLVLPATAVMFLLGLYPRLVVDTINGTVLTLVAQIGG